MSDTTEQEIDEAVMDALKMGGTDPDEVVSLSNQQIYKMSQHAAKAAVNAVVTGMENFKQEIKDLVMLEFSTELTNLDNIHALIPDVDKNKREIAVNRKYIQKWYDQLEQGE